MKEIYQRKDFWFVLVILLLLIFIFPPNIIINDYGNVYERKWEFVLDIKKSVIDIKLLFVEMSIAILAVFGIFLYIHLPQGWSGQIWVELKKEKKDKLEEQPWFDVSILKYFEKYEIYDDKSRISFFALLSWPFFKAQQVTPEESKKFPSNIRSAVVECLKETKAKQKKDYEHKRY